MVDCEKRNFHNEKYLFLSFGGKGGQSSILADLGKMNYFLLNYYSFRMLTYELENCLKAKLACNDHHSFSLSHHFPKIIS